MTSNQACEKLSSVSYLTKKNGSIDYISTCFTTYFYNVIMIAMLLS